MTQLPDPNGIDWGSVALWAAGIGTGLGSMVAAAYLAVRKAVQVAREYPSVITTRRETKVVTTDTVAIHQLAGGIEAIGITVTEIKLLLAAELTARNREREDHDEDEKALRRAREAAQVVQREADEEKDERRQHRPGPRRPNT
ncbi:MAG: hypothetical protein ABI216_21705 [Devosia sp.]